MSDSEGTFSAPEEKKYTCRKCSKEEALCTEWDSSCGGYTDYKYRCKACGHFWWIEGSDSGDADNPCGLAGKGLGGRHGWTARKLNKMGSYFTGCNSYPRCKWIFKNTSDLNELTKAREKEIRDQLRVMAGIANPSITTDIDLRKKAAKDLAARVLDSAFAPVAKPAPKKKEKAKPAGTDFIKNRISNLDFGDDEDE